MLYGNQHAVHRKNRFDFNVKLALAPVGATAAGDVAVSQDATFAATMPCHAVRQACGANTNSTRTPLGSRTMQ